MILLFICISYLLKVFRFDTGIFCDSFAVPLLKTLSQLQQSATFDAWFCFIRLLVIFSFSRICDNDFLNVNRSVAESCCSLGFSWFRFLTLSKLVLFEFPVLIPLVFYLIQSVSAEETLNCISRIRFRRTFIWPWVNQYMVYGFDSSSIGHFPAMVCSIWSEGCLNLVTHWI